MGTGRGTNEVSRNLGRDSAGRGDRWTLLHSLWEGAILSAVLASALLTMRASRARYVAACVAMLVMLGGVGLTLVRVMPENVHGRQTARMHAFPAWNIRIDQDASSPSNHPLAAVVPWLAPFWIVGVWIFYSGTWSAGYQYADFVDGACVLRPSAGKRRSHD